MEGDFYIVGKVEEKGSLGRPGCRSEDNIKINIQYVRREIMHWRYSANSSKGLLWRLQ
jgi:hypothetical protein